MEELRSIVSFIGQGGIAIIVFIIWYFTFTQATKETKAARKENAELTAQLILLIKEDSEHKCLLAGIMMRLEEKLSIPAQCPILQNHVEIKNPR